MAGTKVSVLTAGAALGGTEAIPAVQSAATVKITAAQIKTFTSASPTLVTPVLGVATGTSLAVTGSLTSSAGIIGGNSGYVTSYFDMPFGGADFQIQSSAYAGGNPQLHIKSTGISGWSSGNASAALDTGLSRISAGVIGVGTGAQGSVAGRLDLATMNVAGGAFGGDGNWWSGNNLNIRGTTQLSFGAADVILTRGGVATLQHGNFDAASPVAQTIKFQSVVAGTTNTAGVDSSYYGSAGTGTGAGGAFKWYTSPAGSTGSTQNAGALAMQLTSAGHLLVGNPAAGFSNTGINALGMNLGTASTAPPAGEQIGFYKTNIKVGAFEMGVRLKNNDTFNYEWSSTSVYSGASDTNLSRISAGNIGVGTGAQGSTAGTLQLAGVANLTGALTLRHGNTDDVRIQNYTAANPRLGFYTSGTTNNGVIETTADGVFTISNGARTDFSLLRFGGTTSSFPALKRSTTSLQARLADDSAFTAIQGKLTTDTAYTAGDPTTTGYLLVYDSTGTAYRVPALLN